MNDIDKKFLDVIDTIKSEITNTKQRVFENANIELIGLYFRIGKYIFENANYGTRFVEHLSLALRLEFPNVTGYSTRNLARMRKFYDEYHTFSILPPVVAKLPWAFSSAKKKISYRWNGL